MSKPLDQVTNTKVDEPVNKKLDAIIGTFISLKFDVDTDEFSDGTLERWNDMKQSILALIASEKEKELKLIIDRHTAIARKGMAITPLIVANRIQELKTIKENTK